MKLPHNSKQNVNAHLYHQHLWIKIKYKFSKKLKKNGIEDKKKLDTWMQREFNVEKQNLKPNTLWDEWVQYCYVLYANSQHLASYYMLRCLPSIGLPDFHFFLLFCFMIQFFLLLLLHGSSKSMLYAIVIPFWTLSVQVCFLLLLLVELSRTFIRSMDDENK